MTCENFSEFRQDDESCSRDVVEMRSGKEVSSDKICDGYCHWENECEDEASCNGFNYGIYCTTTSRYIQPVSMNCLIGASNYKNCLQEPGLLCGNETDYCYLDSMAKLKLPLLEVTRCSARSIAGNGDSFNMALCEDGRDQTNCSDPTRVAGRCLIDGYLSTVSNYVTCSDGTGDNISKYRVRPDLCDDGLENKCVTVSSSCHVHKHKLCDQKIDCPDRNDELTSLCATKSTQVCNRRFGEERNFQTFPMSWIKDGVIDCMNGEDELQDWETCGSGLSVRYKNYGSSCSEVFLCPSPGGEATFIEQEQLCDKVETCGNENKICEMSHSGMPAYREAVRVKSSEDSKMEVGFSFCLPGLENIRHHMKVSCKEVEFVSQTNTFVGRTSFPKLRIPDVSNQECGYLYGENYVYTSCSGKCKEGKCPLTRQLKHSSCPGQFSNRVIAMFGPDSLTFAISQRHGYQNDYFLCENNRCIEFKQVCDLVDNCGDGSDERDCSNHFKCINNSYVAVSQMCDGVINCFDFSDECNSLCGKEIINSIPLKIVAWIFGGTAVLLNLLSIGNNMSVIWKKNCTKPSFKNQVFVTAIGVADLSIGIYLLCLAITDLRYGKGYCLSHIEWLSSRFCSVIGILSTVGSQLSLFSVTTLSVMRIIDLQNIFIAREKASVKFKCKQCLLLGGIYSLSIAIAVTPLLPWWQDIFVNGLVYEKSNKLFSGVVTKRDHIDIFREYFGRIAGLEHLPSWDLINDLVDSMFSSDYGGIKRKTLDFYGNDGVCLFKYIVNKDDPQRVFVWLTLGINVLCVSFTVVSYGMVATILRKSRKAVQQFSNADRVQLDKQSQLNRKITVIIITDLCCWIPFVIICLLHSLSMLDATPLYPVLSIVVLPLNSVVNPVLYSNLASDIFGKVANLVGLSSRNVRPTTKSDSQNEQSCENSCHAVIHQEKQSERSSVQRYSRNSHNQIGISETNQFSGKEKRIPAPEKTQKEIKKNQTSERKTNRVITYRRNDESVHL